MGWTRAWISTVLVLAGCGGPASGVDAGGADGQIGIDAGPVALCERDLDCVNGEFCDGAERCLPGTAGAGPDGCVAGTSPCSATDTCDETADECVSVDCSEPDADDDGDASLACGGGDCDDTNPNIRSEIPEVCDALGVNEDCDPLTIHNEDTNDGDRDRDDFIDTRCFNVLDDGTENRGTDCDDTAPTINLDGVEACDLRDNDCDGMVDEGVLNTYYRDADGDGAGDESMTMQGCTAPAGGWVLMAGDCDDTRSNVHPGAAEVCDGIDNDCGGDVDEAPAGTLYYLDRDADGYGDPSTSMRACGSPGADWVATAGDCWDDYRERASLVRPGGDWQTTPFCRMGSLCGSGATWECRLPRELPFAPCLGASTGAPEWDYNCSGSVNAYPLGEDENCYLARNAVECVFSGMAYPGFEDPRRSDCGLWRPYYTGDCIWNSTSGSCSAEIESRQLSCR